MAKKFKWPKTVRTVKMPLYPGTIHYVYNKDDYFQIINYLDPKNDGRFPVDEDSLPLGLSIFTGHPETKEVLYLVCVFDGDIQTLVHECGHIALYVCKHVGIDPLNGDEAFCYLLDWIFGQATPETTEQNKGEKNEFLPDKQEVLDQGGEIGTSSGDRRSVRPGSR